MKLLSLQKTTLLLFPILSVFALLTLIVIPVLGDEDRPKNSSQLSQSALHSIISLNTSSQQTKSLASASQRKKLKDKTAPIKLAEQGDKTQSEQSLQGLDPNFQRAGHSRNNVPQGYKQPNRAKLAAGSRGGSSLNSLRRRSSRKKLSAPLSQSTPVLSIESETTSNKDLEDEEDEEEEDEDTPSLGPTIDTPVLGKVMSRQTRKGIPNVSVTILVFHPLSTVSASPVWIVPVTVNTDKNGVFSTTLAIPERQVPGAALGLSFVHGSHSDLAGVPITQIFPGHEQNIGIFWLSNRESALQGTITPAHLAENATIIDTGGLNPLAWDSRIRNNILALFPLYRINKDEYSLSFTQQDSSHNNQRWVSLFAKNAWIGSQSVTWKKVDVERNGELKKETIGFADFTIGPDNSLRGSVTAQNGGALQGAVVTALTNGSAPSQTAITGPNGDFRFAKAPLTIRAFQVSHNDYLTQEFSAAKSGQSPVLILQNRRPNIPMLLTNSVSGDPIPSVKATLRSSAAPGQPFEQTVLNLQNPTGQYQLTAAFPIGQIIFEREGYFRKVVNNPENYPTGTLETKMVESRIILLTARDNVGKSDRWTEIGQNSLVTYWSQKWLEFEVDYGDEATAFDMEIGVRNHGIIDHKYKFDIRVDIPGEASQRIKILASQSDTLTARLVCAPKTGVKKFRMTWLNDRWIPKQLDANILVDWVKFHQRPLTPAEEAQVAANNTQ